MTPTHRANQTPAEGTYFGIPLGDLGWFQSLLMGIAVGMIGFLLSTFLSIVALLIYTTVTRHPVDFAVSYKRIGLPIGLGAATAAFGFLGYLWVQRVFVRGSRRRDI